MFKRNFCSPKSWHQSCPRIPWPQWLATVHRSLGWWRSVWPVYTPGIVQPYATPDSSHACGIVAYSRTVAVLLLKAVSWAYLLIWCAIYFWRSLARGKFAVTRVDRWYMITWCCRLASCSSLIARLKWYHHIWPNAMPDTATVRVRGLWFTAFNIEHTQQICRIITT